MARSEVHDPGSPASPALPPVAATPPVEAEPPDPTAPPVVRVAPPADVAPPLPVPPVADPLAPAKTDPPVPGCEPPLLVPPPLPPLPPPEPLFAEPHAAAARATPTIIRTIWRWLGFGMFVFSREEVARGARNGSRNMGSGALRDNRGFAGGRCYPNSDRVGGAGLCLAKPERGHCFRTALG